MFDRQIKIMPACKIVKKKLSFFDDQILSYRT